MRMNLAWERGVPGVEIDVRLSRDGVPVVHHAADRPNPTTPTPLDDFLEQVLLGEAPFVDYLKAADHPRMGISVAVPVADGVPYHPSKLATIDGLCARDPRAEAATHHLGRRLEAFFSARGLPSPKVVYEGDGPVAHLGGVSLSEVAPDDRSLLMVCGNGMATADYRRYAAGVLARRLLERCLAA